MLRRQMLFTASHNSGNLISTHRLGPLPGCDDPGFVGQYFATVDHDGDHEHEDDGGEGKVMLQLMMMNLKVMLLLRLLASVQ